MAGLLWLFYGASWVLVLSHRIAPVCVGVGVSVTCLYQNWCFYYLTLSHILVFYLFALISTFDRVSVLTSKTATLLPLIVCHCLQHWAAPTVSGYRVCSQLKRPQDSWVMVTLDVKERIWTQSNSGTQGWVRSVTLGLVYQTSGLPWKVVASHLKTFTC